MEIERALKCIGENDSIFDVGRLKFVIHDPKKRVRGIY